MSYRMDWQVWLRANKKESAQRLLNRLLKAIDEQVSITSFMPQHGQRGIWECCFSTAEWDVPFAEAVVRCMQMAATVAKAYEWKYAPIGQSALDGDLFSGFFVVTHPSSPGTWLTGLQWAGFTLAPADSPMPAPQPDIDNAYGIAYAYTVWIEAEHWQNGVKSPNLPKSDWSPEDACSDVHVTFENGAFWIATFITYQHVETLRRKFHDTGECLNGRYMHIDDMVLVEKISRECIEEVICNMLQKREFDRAFRLEWTNVKWDDE